MCTAVRKCLKYALTLYAPEEIGRPDLIFEAHVSPAPIVKYHEVQATTYYGWGNPKLSQGCNHRR